MCQARTDRGSWAFSLLAANSTDRQNSRLTRGQRSPHDSSPQRLTPRCLPSRGRRSTTRGRPQSRDTVPRGLPGGRAAATRGPGPAGSGGGRAGAGAGWARAGGGWQRPGRAEPRRLQPRAPGAGGGSAARFCAKGRSAAEVTWCRCSEGKAEPASSAAAAEILRAPPALPRPPGAPAPPARRVPAAPPQRPARAAPHTRARGSRSASALSSSGPARGLPPRRKEPGRLLPRLPPPQNGAVGASGASSGREARRVNSDFHSGLYCLTHWLSHPVFPLFPSYPAFLGFPLPLIRRPPLMLWLWHSTPRRSVGLKRLGSVWCPTEPHQCQHRATETSGQPHGKEIREQRLVLEVTFKPI